MPRPFRICLIFHSTRSDNLGVGALSVAEIAILRDIAADLGIAIPITVMEWTAPLPSYVDGPDIEIRDLNGRVMLNPMGYFAIARRSDLVIDIGGGDSFADVYQSRRMIRMLIVKYLTHLSGTPLVMAPQTIGPFHKRWSKALSKLSLRLCALVATRDAQSTAAVRQMGLTRDIIEASDVALRLPYDPPPPRPEGARMRVGINVSGLLMGAGYTGQNEFGLTMDYPTLIRRLIAHFQAHPDGCEVHLVSHVIVRQGAFAGEDDLAASIALGKEFPRTVVAPAFASPSEAKSYIAQLDFFMGARMHACIAAFSSGVPVIPMAYSRKFSGLFGSIGYDRTADCTSETAEEVFEKIAAAYENRIVLADEAAVALAEGKSRLGQYETALRNLIERRALT